jgi:nitroimidazol reductase NimA-like FMN-containing flavoprotein (pyridoxamine 5'-phosphate oxidase superfamily)
MPQAPKVTIFSKSETEEFLKSQRVGVLAMNDGKNSYAIPLAYSYDSDTIYLTLGPGGRKSEYIRKNKNVSFVVYALPKGFGSPGTMNFKSAILDGMIEQITDAEGLRKAAKVFEKAIGMPEGGMNPRIEKILKDPLSSTFWKVSVTNFGGKGVEEEF